MVRVEFVDLKEGVSFTVEKWMRQTGYKEKVITETRDKKVNPAIHIIGNLKGEILKRTERYR